MKNIKTILFLTFLNVLCFAKVSGQHTLFVSTTGDDNNVGDTWETAKGSIAGALSAVNGTTHIFVKVGTYVCHDALIPDGVTVTGGYASSSTGTDTTQRQYPGGNANWGSSTWCTRLNGGNTTRVATVNTGGKLEGCVIFQGRTTELGGGVLIDGGTVSHCAIINNYAVDPQGMTAKGGGAYVRNNGYLLNCVVAKNYANNGPGVAGTDGTLTNNTITANFAYSHCGPVTDYDGNVYSTILIGNQCWMKENLRTAHYADGAEIPLITSGTSSTVAYRYCPNNDTNNVGAYGYLYNWSAVMGGESASNANPSGRQGICPTGWHVPSQSEWTQLIDYVSAQNAYLCQNEAGAVAKALASPTGWNGVYCSSYPCSPGCSPSSNNLTGFNVRPAGYIESNTPGQFGSSGCFWTTSYYNTDRAYCCNLSYNYEKVTKGNMSKWSACSVRCLRDLAE